MDGSVEVILDNSYTLCVQRFNAVSAATLVGWCTTQR